MLRQALARRAKAPTWHPHASPSPFLQRRYLSTTETTTPATTPASPNSTTSPSINESSMTIPPPVAPQYRVSRTFSNALPVYNCTKAGGNLKLTTLKKIEGDAKAFRNDLMAALGETEEKNVKINPVTGHIRVKGHREREIKTFLEKLGF